jgi:hypothetical protein
LFHISSFHGVLIISTKKQRFNLVSEQKRKAYTWYDDQTREGKEVGVKTIYVDQVRDGFRIINPSACTETVLWIQFTGRQLDSKDLVSFFAVGGKSENGAPRKVQFSPDELKQLKTFGLNPSEGPRFRREKSSVKSCAICA